MKKIWVLGFVFSLCLSLHGAANEVQLVEATGAQQLGLLTLKQVAQLEPEVRTRYFRNLRKAVVLMAKMQKPKNKDLFGANEPRERRFYSFVFSLTQQAYADDNPSTWNRGYGNPPSAYDSCIYAGHLRTYSIDPTLGPLGCRAPKSCKTSTGARGVPCNLMVFGQNECTASRADSTSACQKISNEKIRQITKDSKSRGELAAIKAEMKALAADIENLSPGMKLAKSNGLMARATPYMVDPEVMGMSAQIASHFKPDSMPPTLNHFSEYDDVVKGYTEYLGQFADHCNKPLSDQVIDRIESEAKAGNRRAGRELSALKKARGKNKVPVVGNVVQVSECQRMAGQVAVISNEMGETARIYIDGPDQQKKTQAKAPVTPGNSSKPVGAPVEDVVVEKPVKRGGDTHCEYNPSALESRLAPTMLQCAACMAEYAGKNSGVKSVATAYHKDSVSKLWTSMMYIMDRECGRGLFKASVMGKSNKVTMGQALQAFEKYGHCSESTFSKGAAELEEKLGTKNVDAHISGWMANGLGKDEHKAFAAVFGADPKTLKAVMCDGKLSVDKGLKSIAKEQPKVKISQRELPSGKSMEVKTKYTAGQRSAMAKKQQHRFKNSAVYKCLQEAKQIKDVQLADSKMHGKKSVEELKGKKGPHVSHACVHSGHRKYYEDFAKYASAATGVPVIYSNDSQCVVSTGFYANGEGGGELHWSSLGKSEVDIQNMRNVTAPGAQCGSMRTTKSRRSLLRAIREKFHPNDFSTSGDGSSSAR